MPTDLAAEAARTATAFGLVAAGAVPVGAATWLAARCLGRPLLPRWGVPTARWTALDAVVLFGLNAALPLFLVVGLSGVGLFQVLYGPDFPAFALAVPDTDAAGAVGGGPLAAAADRIAVANQLRALCAMAVSTPLVLAAAVGLWAVENGRWPTLGGRDVLGRVAFGVLGWLVLTPPVLAANAVTTWVAEAVGVEPEPHPLTRVDLTDSAATVLLFGVIVCGLTPLVEELIFRGVLLPWSARRSGGPWAVLAAGVVWAAISGGLAAAGVGLAAFVALLFVGLAPVTRLRHPRTVAAVYATGAAFALVHANVWPTPVPLFPLGLGLGWLAARTRGIVAPTVAHGLFNAVSFVILLRDGAG